MKILVTGTAGFIGHHLGIALAERGDTVVGLDNINDYYDVEVKHGRLRAAGFDIDALEEGKPLVSEKYPAYSFYRLDMEDMEKLSKLFEDEKFDCVVNMAAQAGVRYSLRNPHAYVSSNLAGFVNLLECCRYHEINHLVYASSSSVYGLNESQPFSVKDSVSHPISLYAATKKSNELMAHSYSWLYGLPVTGLRFFTVYGPWGRPDMAPYLFTKAIFAGETINVFNNGDMWRDFTYVGDIVEGVVRVMDRVPEPNTQWDAESPDPSTSKAPYRVFNIGNSRPVKLMDFIKTLENAIGKEAVKNMMPMQPGDVQGTFADVSDLAEYAGYKPSTDLSEGIEAFVSWFREFHKID